MVVCTALIRPPVQTSIAKTEKPACAPIDMAARTSAPATAPAAIVSIDSRDPRRMMTRAPTIAPTTPPKLNAVRPWLAVPISKWALDNTELTQLVPMYTESKQKKNDPQRASVSRRYSGTKSSRTDGGGTDCSVGSMNAASDGTS